MVPPETLFFTRNADISWQSGHTFQTPQFQIVECACHDDATQAQYTVGASSPMPSWLGIGGHTGGSRHKHPRYTSTHTVGRPWVAPPHTRAHGTTQQTRTSPKQTHQVTNTDSVIRAQEMLNEIVTKLRPKNQMLSPDKKKKEKEKNQKR